MSRTRLWATLLACSLGQSVLLNDDDWPHAMESGPLFRVGEDTQDSTPAWDFGNAPDLAKDPTRQWQEHQLHIQLLPLRPVLEHEADSEGLSEKPLFMTWLLNVTSVLTPLDVVRLEQISGIALIDLLHKVSLLPKREILRVFDVRERFVRGGIFEELNKNGLHLLRALCADRLVQNRRRWLGFESEMAREFERTGLLVLPLPGDSSEVFEDHNAGAPSLIVRVIDPPSGRELSLVLQFRPNASETEVLNSEHKRASRMHDLFIFCLGGRDGSVAAVVGN